ncbi:MAG: von Willebrand factor type A protein [Candidatus Scalindua rubra]|uniref:von Willebrand factor type A protein n=1 Tax=Candidatus Scalindua rubra TaxID=1872076 RepID=A0A1E3X764_9BACT|nr:MAG: von Willebrand factor type A protein [Candidatus Scalindua rubra]
MIILKDPLVLVLIIILIPLILANYILRRDSGNLRFSSLSYFKKIRQGNSARLRHILIALRILIIVLLVIALARPQSGKAHSKVTTEGIDIILALDISGSMLAEDFNLNDKRRNRLYVAKEVVKDFIKWRENDRIGMVVFAGQSYTQCPLTLDYDVLLQFLEKVEIGMVEDGTAIGSAIGVCVNRLKSSKAKSKVVILLTDGRNNAGEIDPLTAAELAKTYDMKIYTVGAGTKGLAPYPTKNLFGFTVYRSLQIDIDDEGLTEIANITDGKYFRATDTESLKEIYKQIDNLEKTKMEVAKYTEYNELFQYLAIPALGMFLFEIVLANTRFRKIP